MIDYAKGRLVIGRKETMHLLGVKETTLHKLMNENKLVRIKIGRSTKITVASIDKLLSDRA